MSASLIVGIDGGGSKTHALLADADGRVLGQGIAGPSNYQGIGAEAAQAALDAAIAAAFADAGLALAPIAAVCLGLAGMDRPDDRALFAAWAAERLPGAAAVFVNDAELVLAAGTPSGCGVALICGTGSIAFGRDARGRTARSRGWGYLLGDEGSGYDLGLAALRAVMRSHDGRGAQTALTPAVLGHWGLASPTGLVPVVYQGLLRPADVAALAALVDAVAAGGDAVAREILQRAGQELALAVVAVVRSLDLAAPVPCALAGGVIVKGQPSPPGRLLLSMFLEAAGALGVQLEPVTPVTEPARGALRLAQKLLAPAPE